MFQCQEPDTQNRCHADHDGFYMKHYFNVLYVADYFAPLLFRVSTD